MMMSQPQLVDQNDVDDFDLDDIIFELECGDDNFQDVNTPIGMEGVEMTTSPPIHSNQDFAKKPELGSRVFQHMMSVDSLYYDSTAATSSDSGDFISYPVGSAMPSSTSQNIKSEFPAVSPIQQVSHKHQRHHELRRQLLMQKIQRPHNQPSLTLQANALYTNHIQQNHTGRDQHQSYPLLMPTIPQDRRQIGRLPNQQQLYLDSIIYGMQPQQRMFKTQSVAFREKTHQNASHMFQRTGFTAPHQIIQKSKNPVQVNFMQPRISKKPNNSSQDDLQHSSQKSAMLGHQQGIRWGGQQKPLDLLQGVNIEGWPGASVDPVVRSEHAALSDWHCQAYLQIQSIKETCLPDLRRLHNKANELVRKAPNSRLAAKHEKTRVFFEKMIKFLHTSRDDLISISKGKFYSQMKTIISYINSSKIASSTQHREQLQPYGSMSRQPQLRQEESMKQKFSPQCGSPHRVPNTEINTTNSTLNVSFPGSGKGNSSTMLPNVHTRWPQQTSMPTSYDSSLMEMDHRTLGSLQAGFFNSANHNLLGMQQTNFSPRTNINSFNSTRITVAATATILPSFSNNNETWNQNVQFEKLKQTMHQSPTEKSKKQVVQKTSELNDALVGHATSPRSIRRQLQYSVCQPADFSPQILLSSSPSHLHTTSPQAAKNSVSSSTVDTNIMLSPLSKCGTSVQPATSPLILASPSTPSSLAVDTEKGLSTVILTAVESMGHPRTLEREIFATNKPGTSTTSLLTDSACANDNQHSHAMGRLIDAVKSLSSKAFHATLEDFNYVMNVIDCIDGTPRGPVGQDLVADVRFHLQNVTDFGMEDGPCSTEKLRRNINALVLGASSSTIDESNGDNFAGLTDQASDVESTSTSMNKRLKNELTDAISKEIKEINRKLVETLLELVSDGSNEVDRLGAQEDTTVRCTYTAVCFPELLRPQFALSGTLPNFRLLLFVPEDYPNSSPVVLDVFSDFPSEQLEELLDKAKVGFNMSLRTLSQPICLLEMARSWNASCRAACTEFARKRGGMSFSERYGSWEKCITAP